MKKSSNKYKVAVLITSHNRKDKTIKCLASLFGVDLPLEIDLNVYLVDDGSTDGTADVIKNRFPQVTIIRGDGSLYWNKGMNLAWKVASEEFPFDYYLWLNDDVNLFQDSVKTLIENFSQHTVEEKIIVGACRSVSGETTYTGYRNLIKKFRIKPNGLLQSCDFFNGNVVLIPSAVFKRIGFLDTIFHHGKGDFDYGLRAKKEGISSFVSSSFVGVCERHEELPQWCNPNYPLSVRWKGFKSPLGGKPKSMFIIHYRHINLWYALYHYFTIYVRFLLPGIWIWLKKTNE